MPQIIQNQFDFSQLSLKDLIEARDLFHVHLMNRRNVIATALGRYRIRKTDPFPGAKNFEENLAERRKNRGARTLLNSEVRHYSWPCILAFVERWEDKYSLIGDDY